MFENEKIVEVKTCKHCQSKFEITDKDLEFYEKISPCFASPSMEGDGGGVKKYLIPTPTLCPDCRQQRRLSFRNERKLYKRLCDATGKPIISMYSPDKPYKVYNQDFWWSDKWDALDYGRDFDFNRGFFEQFEELMREVPRMSLFNNYKTLENSEYTNYLNDSKNCYMSFDGGDNEDCLYCYWFGGIKDSLDLDFSMNSNNCYKSTDLDGCSFCYFSENCCNSNNCYFIYNCNGCNNCFNCTNLTNKSFCINNIQYSKEEYQKLRDNLLKSNFEENILKFNNLKDKAIRKIGNFIKSELCYGNNLHFSKNSYGFEGRNIEDSKYIYSTWDTKNSFDCYELSYNSEKCYELISSDSVKNGLLSSNSLKNDHIIYSDLIFNSSNIFGCIGLRNKSYCILNKQYTKEEYEALVPKIIEHMQKSGEWGEFFPSWVSPFGYNETVAMEYFPLDRDVALQHLYKWSTYEPPYPKVDKIIKASMLPEDITKIPDDILNRAIECEVTKKPFRIIAQELEFYRKHNLPIPKRHPDQRHLDRMSLRNPRKLFDRKCDKCGKDIKTTYSPDRKEIVYCEECYNREIY